jgi:hypothetical protein
VIISVSCYINLIEVNITVVLFRFMHNFLAGTHF